MNQISQKATVAEARENLKELGRPEADGREDTGGDWAGSGRYLKCSSLRLHRRRMPEHNTESKSASPHRCQLGVSEADGEEDPGGNWPGVERRETWINKIDRMKT